MTYREVLERLFAARRFGVVLGLDRVQAALARLGSPERRLGSVVHVGGTNGKGSTAAMIAAIATAAGRRVAVYSSPHLSTMRERIVCGRMIAEEEVVAAYQAIDTADLTFFEQLTVLAIQWIASQRPDLTVLEVGLGGRLDATNAIDADIAAVTGVAMDHQAILGPTLEAIAAEKAGIFKRGRRAVIGCSGEASAVPALVAGARAAGVARLTLATVVADSALAGEHQRRNAATVLAVIDHLEALGALSAPSWIRDAGLAAVQHPGRLERLPDGTLLDGAHNPQGTAALAAALASSPRPITLILAVSADKDVAAMLAPLRGVVDTLVCTRYQQPRSLDADALAAIARTAGFADVRTAPDLAAALALARGPVVVAGSLMLVGEARSLLLGAPTDPFVVTDPAPAP